MKLYVLVFLISFLSCIASFKILVVYPLPVKSLNILGHAVVKYLLNEGHEVTFITTHPINKPNTKNFRQIDISSNVELLNNDTTWNISNIIGRKVENNIFGIQELCSETARQTFLNSNVTAILENPNEHFDVVVADLLESEVYAGFSVLYNCPMVWVYSLGVHWQAIRLISDPSSPAYETDYYGINIPPFTFTQRVQELFSRAKWSYYKTFYAIPAERDIYEHTFKPLLAKRGRTLPDYEDVIYNSSMIFSNEHNAVINRPSLPHNFKYVGGIHIEDPVKPLPKDLQNLMDNAPHGVIYFSMGSLWRAKDLPIKLIRELLEMFGQLKQRVIWKYEDDLKDVPQNVHILKWAPQPAILVHPNCKLFISHGGLHSAIEAIHFGVPVIGVPVLFDQALNVVRAVASGYAIHVNLGFDMATNLKAAINTMLRDEKYGRKAKELSFIYHDRPLKPGAELTFWLRHVVQTRGAAHLRSPALHVPLYQRLYLDLVALVIVIIFIAYSLLKMLLKNSNSKNLKKKIQ